MSDKHSGIEYIETILKYVTNAVPKENITYEDLKTVVEKTLTPEIGEKLMPTIADALRQEGLDQGLQQGMQQGIEKGSLETAIQAVVDNLEVRFDFVSQEIFKMLSTINDISLLRALHRKSIKVESINEFKQILELMLV